MKLVLHDGFYSLPHEVHNSQGGFGPCNFKDSGPTASPEVLLVCGVKESDWIRGYHRPVQKVVAQTAGPVWPRERRAALRNSNSSNSGNPNNRKQQKQ